MTAYFAYYDLARKIHFELKKIGQDRSLKENDRPVAVQNLWKRVGTFDCTKAIEAARSLPDGATAIAAIVNVHQRIVDLIDVSVAHSFGDSGWNRAECASNEALNTLSIFAAIPETPTGSETLFTVAEAREKLAAEGRYAPAPGTFSKAMKIPKGEMGHLPHVADGRHRRLTMATAREFSRIKEPKNIDPEAVAVSILPKSRKN
jgi:hypothetical protein